LIKTAVRLSDSVRVFSEELKINLPVPYHTVLVLAIVTTDELSCNCLSSEFSANLDMIMLLLPPPH